MDFSNVKSDMDMHPRELSEEDVCDWCQDKKAIMTDHTHVYCSEACRESFVNDCLEAMAQGDNDWYKDNIEEGVRGVVKLLRDNGFNTECSCEHGKYVQCQYITDDVIQRLDNLLFNHGFRNYAIYITIKRDDGHIFSTMDIKFNDLGEMEDGKEEV